MTTDNLTELERTLKVIYVSARGFATYAEQALESEPDQRAQRLEMVRASLAYFKYFADDLAQVMQEVQE